MKLKKILFSALISTLPIFNLSLFASELLIANSDSIEEIKKSKIKKSKLIVKFCSGLENPSGYVVVDQKKYFVKDADTIKSKKIVWKNVDSNSDFIDTSNLKAMYPGESLSKNLIQGDCDDSIGILGALLIIGAGIAAGGGGGSGSTSSN